VTNRKAGMERLIKDDAAIARLPCASQYDVVPPGVSLSGEHSKSLPLKIQRLGTMMLTLRDGENHEIEPLDSGSRDNVGKALGIRDLAQPTQAAIKISASEDHASDKAIGIGGIELYPTRRLVLRNARLVRLTPKEFDLLYYLMVHAGTPIAHARLLRSVWGVAYGNELEYLRTYVYQLRKKLENDPSAPEYLLTEHSFGYRFAEGIGIREYSKSPADLRRLDSRGAFKIEIDSDGETVIIRLIEESGQKLCRQPQKGPIHV
jgi:two-component system KDP operon response regulator KdpE